MIHLLVERTLNTKNFFKLHRKIYMPISEDGEWITCRSVDEHNYAKLENVHIDDIPKSFSLYLHRITNSHQFVRDNVIIAYQKYSDKILKVHGIIRQCSDKMITFTFGDIGGEIKTQGLTAHQIAENKIVIMMYPEPVIV